MFWHHLTITAKLNRRLFLCWLIRHMWSFALFPWTHHWRTSPAGPNCLKCWRRITSEGFSYDQDKSKTDFQVQHSVWLKSDSCGIMEQLRQIFKSKTCNQFSESFKSHSDTYLLSVYIFFSSLSSVFCREKRCIVYKNLYLLHDSALN